MFFEIENTEPDDPHPVYILKKIVNRMGLIQFTFPNENVNRMAPHTVYILEKNCKSDGGPSDLQIFFQNINRTWDIPFIRSLSSPMQIHR